MKSIYPLIVLTVVLAFFHAPVKPQSEADSRQSKAISSTGNAFLIAGEPFLVARARILRMGWHPTRMHTNDDYEHFGAEKELADRKFLEVESCSMDAGGHCMLYYNKKMKCLRVDTVGEKIDEMKVTRWTDECPDKGAIAGY